MPMENLWNVLMSAILARRICARRRAVFSGVPFVFSSFKAFLSAFIIFSFISDAAALLNVTISMLSTEMPLSITSCFMRSVSTAVLPDPAAADTSISLPPALIACSCCSVHFMPIKRPHFPTSYTAVILSYPHAFAHRLTVCYNHSGENYINAYTSLHITLFL